MGVQWEERWIQAFSSYSWEYHLSSLCRSKDRRKSKKKVSGKSKNTRKSNPKRSAHKIRANRKTARRIVEPKLVRKPKRKPVEQVKKYVEVKFEPSTKPAEQPAEVITSTKKQVKKRKLNRLVKKPDIKPAKEIEKVETIEVETKVEVIEPVIEVTKTKPVTKEIDTVNATPLHDMGGGYVEYDGKLFSKTALKELRPDLFSIRADSSNHINTNFGTNFPKIAKKGDVFVRVDVMPNRIFKFDGLKWIEVNKENTSSYLYDKEYIKYLISKIDSGEYDLDLLSENEKEEISEYLKNQNSWFYFKIKYNYIVT